MLGYLIFLAKFLFYIFLIICLSYLIVAVLISIYKSISFEKTKGKLKDLLIEELKKDKNEENTKK